MYDKLNELIAEVSALLDQADHNEKTQTIAGYLFTAYEALCSALGAGEDE